MEKITTIYKKILTWTLIFAFMLPIASKTSFASKSVDNRIEINEFLEKVENKTVSAEEIEYFIDTLPKDVQGSIENEMIEVISKIKFNEHGKPYLKDDVTFYNEQGNEKIRETLENMDKSDAEELESFLEQRVAISLALLIEMLINLGFAWIVTEIMNYGVRATCKKHSNANSTFRKYCKTMGYI